MAVAEHLGGDRGDERGGRAEVGHEDVVVERLVGLGRHADEHGAAGLHPGSISAMTPCFSSPPAKPSAWT